MIRSIIKYIGIALVIVGVLLVMKNLFTKEPNWNDDKEKETIYYSANIKLLDKETNDYVEGSKLLLKDEFNKIIASWTTNNKVYTVNNLTKGNYTIIQETAPENYHLNKETITFEIKDSNKNIVMYNTKMTEAEIKEANTVKTEVGVDNTASNKNILTTLIAIITIIIGLRIINKELMTQ